MHAARPGRRMAMLFCCLLLFSGSFALRAQATSSSSGLVISILQGEGALNDIRQRTAREPIVQVQDENHKPVAGAAVLFLLPDSGPSGTFINGTQVFSTVTDSAGRAAAQAFRPNGNAGSLNIRVRVTWHGTTAETTIHQRNVSNEASPSETEHAAHALSLKSLLIILGSAAAAGTVAGILATRGSSATTITAGAPAVGAPTAGVKFHFSLGHGGR